MSEYSELQVALINARDSYEIQRSDFPDPKDRLTHKSQCDLISNHIRDLSEIARLESDNEALRARVAELESQARQFICSGTGPLSDEANSYLPIMILRKQAEAIGACETKLNNTPGAMLWDMDQVQLWLDQEAQRLRQQADELDGRS